MAGMDFYHIQDNYKYIIEEGYFHVPESILKPIKDFYIENYKQYLENGKGKISRRLYPPKHFELDFSGTRFEKLNDRKPSIVVYITSKRSYYYDYNHDMIDTMFLYNQGNIYLQLNPNVVSQVLNNTIEHEVMHYIQSLMERMHKKAGGGYPNRRLWRKDVDEHGRRISGTGRTRVSHSLRPVEYYPDLLTAIRTLFSDYHKMITHYPNYDELLNNTENKKEFFSAFLHGVNNPDYGNDKRTDYFNKSLTVDIFRDFKKISPEFYKKILKIAYDAFINRESNFDPKEIEKQLKVIDLHSRFNRLEREEQ